jgi:hypothetical protein
VDAIEFAQDALRGRMRRGLTLQQAAADVLGSNMIPRESIEEAVRRIREAAEGIIRYKIPRGVVAPAVVAKPWYEGPHEGDECWPKLKVFLQESAGLDTDAVDRLNKASTRIVAHLPCPAEGKFGGRGLVIGYVQSGKTTNFTAVMSKAADEGYRLFVVLSGIHNNLRRQTQVRLREQLIDLNKSLWVPLTSDTQDFGTAPSADSLLSSGEKRVLCVIKKNPSRLKALSKWLKEASPKTLANCPILVIDDEADQASINVGAEVRSTINKRILSLLDVPRAAYVGYTATPYANLFIDPSGKDLYPKDFIIDLEKPDGYFGPDRIFGGARASEDEDDDDGYDIVRPVTPEDAADLRPPRARKDRVDFDPPVTTSLVTAMEYFLLATAARRARGQRGHSTMLIHTTTFTDIHDRMKDPIQGELNGLVAKLKRDDPKLLAKLEKLWTAEMQKVPSWTLGEQDTGFSDLRPHLLEVVSSADVVIDNYRSQERLDYPVDEADDPRTVIVVGGNTLSRGLTLQGLVVSYFLRTASAYDTLQQMGRWFGYRRGYSDLPRVWMTDELLGYFQFLAMVEDEIRVDIARYEQEHKTPLELVTRVRTHSTLTITSALKMRNAESVEVSYNGSRQQTFIFKHLDDDWLTKNLEATRALVRDALATGADKKAMQLGQTRLARVPVQLITRFLEDYQIHEDLPLKPNLCRDYIARQNEYGELLEWNVMVMGRQGSPYGTLDLGLGDEVGLMARARLDIGDQKDANIKAVMSRIDRIADLDIDRAGLSGAEDDILKQIRDDHDAPGMLLLYPIYRLSPPTIRKPAMGKPPSRPRKQLDAVLDVIGMGLIFPESKHPETTVEYKAVALPAEGGLEDDEVDPAEVDIEPNFDAVAAS